MYKYITVTAQGQITIPAEFRKQLDLGKNQQIKASIQSGKMVLEATKDISDFVGIFKDRAFIGADPGEILAKEENVAFGGKLGSKKSKSATNKVKEETEVENDSKNTELDVKNNVQTEAEEKSERKFKLFK